jgi:hypothetical protein
MWKGESNIVAINTDSYKQKVRSKGRSSAINDVLLPSRSSNLFATCSAGRFHVWNTVVQKIIFLHKIIYRPENLTRSVRVDISVNKHQTEI